MRNEVYRKAVGSFVGESDGAETPPTLCALLHFTVIRDQLQDYAFSAAFIQLDDLSASFVGLQEFGLADIPLQFFKCKHRVLAWI